MIDPDDFAHLFQAPILTGLTRNQKHALLSACTSRLLKPSTYVLRQGETTQGSYFIASGRVEVCYVDSSGNQVIVHIATPGEMLGELRDEGVIELGRNAVRVLDRARLADGAPVIE